MSKKKRVWNIIVAIFIGAVCAYIAGGPVDT